MMLLDTDLHHAIRAAMLAEGVPAFDKRRQVVALVDDALRSLGSFYRATDARLFFFLKPERQLYDLDQRAFQYLLTSLSGLSATEPGFRFVLDMLQADTARTAPVVEIRVLAHYDPATGLLAVSNGGGGFWARERGGSWELAANGDDGILFLTEPGAETWEPVFGNGEALRAYFGGFLFDNAPISDEDQRTLLFVYLLQQLFPPFRRTRMIPTFLGPQGSGKTTGCRRVGRLLGGPTFDVGGVHRDREDAFVATVTNTIVAALDNADARVPWLEDALATYATGRQYDLRRLYTTNEHVRYEPKSILLLNSRDPQFRRPDVAERLLPFYCVRPEAYVSESQLNAELDALRPHVWGALLARAAAIADAGPELIPPPIQFRMADFGSFGWRVFKLAGQESAWLALLGRLERAQMAFAAEGDAVVETLRVLLDQQGGSIGPIPTSELFQACRGIADDEGLPFPRSASGFGKRLTNLRRVLELELRVRFSEQRGHGKRRLVSFAPRSAAGDDDQPGGPEGGRP
jgi:hypothetical protein